MALSPIGWLSGITALSVFIFSILFGIFALYKSRKFKSNLLIYLGLVYIFAALVYTGDVLDFFTILMTGTNMDNSIPIQGIIGLINWIWFPGAVFFAMVFGAFLLIPEKKWYIIIIYLILAVGFEIFLISDLAGSVTYTYPTIPGEDLINDNLVLESFASIIAFIFVGSALIFLGVGFLIKGVQSTGIIRKKFLILSLAAFMYSAGGILDGLFEPNFTLIFIRAAMAISAILFYYGTKA
jgi:hypothetical protein